MEYVKVMSIGWDKEMKKSDCHCEKKENKYFPLCLPGKVLHLHPVFVLVIMKTSIQCKPTLDKLSGKVLPFASTLFIGANFFFGVFPGIREIPVCI